MSARLLKPLALLTLAALAQQAVASGYHFGTQSVTAQGTANAAAAEADDASTLFYNTAGLTKLENHEISVAANMVLPTIKYSDAAAKYYDGSTQVAPRWAWACTCPSARPPPTATTRCCAFI